MRKNGNSPCLRVMRLKARAVFEKFGCYSCHEVRGEKFPAPGGEAVGPELSQMGPMHPLEYFTESTINPNPVGAKKYKGLDSKSKMPTFNDDMTVQELINVSAYLASLRPKGMPKSVSGVGKIIALVPESQIVVDHEEIKGFMDAMTMGYKVNSNALLKGVQSGDEVRFTIDTEKRAIPKIEKLKNWSGVRTQQEPRYFFSSALLAAPLERLISAAALEKAESRRYKSSVSMRQLTAIVLTFLLVYAGAAHVLAACLDGNEHPGHASKALAESHAHHGMSQQPGSHDHAVPDLHCPDLRFKSGPVSGISFASHVSAAGKLRLPLSFATSWETTHVATNLWLRTVFWWLSGFRFITPSRHIFLSILLI